MSATSNSAGAGIKGHLFESKLTTLFMVRAIDAGYQFELATNNEQVGGKFDDVIFRYEVPDNTSKSKHWRYQYVQAKHKVNKTAFKIKTSDLLSTSTTENDYSLFKYFKSFCKFKVRGDDIQDCIVCTTTDFEKNDFEKKDKIQIKPIDMTDEIFFQFGDNFTNKDGTKPTFCKLELPEEVKIELLKYCDMCILTEKLSNPAKSLDLDQEIINTYHIALIKENVIELSTSSTKTIIFHKNFINNLETLSTGAKKLRQKLCELELEKDLAIWESQWPKNFGHNEKDSVKNKPESDSTNRELFKPDDIDILANEFKICITKKTSPSLKHDIFKTYHNILIEENIIDSGIGSKISPTMKFHKDFIDNHHSLTSGAKDLRQLLCKADYEKKLATCKFSRPRNFGKEPAKKLPNISESSDEEQKSDDVKILAEALMTCVTKKPSLTQNVFFTYHIALIKENVIELEMKKNDKKKEKQQTIKFHKDFIDNQDSLTPGAKDLRKMLIDSEFDLAKWEFERPGGFGQEPAQKLPNCITLEDVNYFLEKLYFFVNSPKEDKLDTIVQRDLRKYYNQKDIELEFSRIDKRVLDWYKKEANKKPTWLSSDMSKEIIFDGVDRISIDLMEKLGFQFNAIIQMTEKLKHYMESSNDKIIRVSTPTPKWTAVKIISAIKEKVLERDYWVMSFNLLSESEIQLWKNRLELTKDHLFLIVCGENEPCDFNFESLIPGDPMWMGKIIIISDEENGIKDEINFKDLNTETQSVILNRSISFQKEEIKVGRLLVEMSDDEDVVNLLNNSQMIEKLDKILKLPSIMELMKPEEIKIPSLSPFQSEHFLYIKRKMKDFNCHQKSWTRELPDLTMKTSYDRKTPDSEIWISAWNMANERKSDLWNQMKSKSKNKNLNQFQQIPDEIILSKEYQENCTPVIISAVAGTGKSTLLSHYCTGIKQSEEGKRTWVIPIDLASHKKTLSSLDVKPSTVMDFFVKLTGVDKSPFAKDLLMCRIKEGDRIVYMMDGFNEIDSQSQDKVIKLLSFLRLTKSARLFVSTRPDSQSKLQDGLFAFAFILENFTETDQVECLIDNWEKFIQEQSRLLNSNQTMDQQEKEALEKFATILVDRVSNDLKDEDRSFVGIPLQCRILAESYQQLIFEIIQEHRNAEILVETFKDLLKNQSFDLASLYSLLMIRKLEIFKDKMIKPTSDDGINVYNSCVAIAAKQVKNYLIRMAISVVGGHLNALIKTSFQSMSDRQLEDDELAELGVRFGLLTEKTNPPRFLHTTYAEYLVADYIYQGFLLDYDQHNYLLCHKDVRRWIVNDMFVYNNYEGVRVFFDSMLRGLLESEKWQSYPSGDYSPSHLKYYQNFISEDFLENIKKEKEKSQKDRHFFDVRKFFGCQIHPRIIKLNFDCLDVHYNIFGDKNTALRFIIDAFLDEKEFHIPLIFTHSTEMFQRLLGYYEDGDSSAFFIINGIIDTQSFKKYHNDRGSDVSEVTKTLNQMRFEFTKKNKEKFKQHIDKNGQEETRLSLILHSLSSDPNHHQLFKEYLDFLLETFGEDWFVRFYREKMEFESQGWPNIEKMLEILRNLERENVLQKISQLILVWYPQVFRNFYNQLDPKKEITSEDGTMDINWFLGNPDQSQLCRLHRLAFFGDNQTDGSLNFLDINLKSQDVEMQTLATTVVSSIANDLDGVTPFHLAFIGGHVTLCSRMLQLFKKVSTDSELGRNIVKEKEFVSKLTWDAVNHLENIQFRKENHISCSETIKGILGSITENFGHDFLMELLKETNDSTTSSNFFDKWPMCAKLTYIFPNDHLPSLLQILVDDNNIHLSSELIFSYGSKNVLRSIDTDTFQKIYSTKEGRVYWAQHVLGIAPERDWCQNEVVTMDVEEFESRKLNNEQLAILVEEMTATDGNGTSFWTQCLEKALQEESQNDRHKIFVDITKILSAIYEKLDEIDVGKLLSPNSYSISIRILDILAGYPDKLSICEEATIQEQLANLLKVHANDKILIEIMDSALSQQSPQILKRFSPYEWSNILLFYVEHAESERLSAFVNTITALHYNDIAKNIWSCCTSKIKSSWEGNQKDRLLAKNLGRILSHILKWQEQPINTYVILLFLQDGGWINIPRSCQEGIYCFKNKNLKFILQLHYDRSQDISRLYSDVIKLLRTSVKTKKRLALTRDFEFVKRSGFADGLLSEAAELWKQDSVAYGMIKPEEKEIRNLVGSILDFFNEL